jgi:cell division transport system permease protein
MQHSLAFFFRESLRAMRRNAAPTFAALATVTVTLIVVGVFIPIVQATQGAANGVRNKVFVEAYMNLKATPQQDARAETELKSVADVRRVVFVSKAQALVQGKKTDAGAFELLTGNPLPDSFEIYPTNPSAALAVRAAIDGSGPGGTGKMIDSAIAKVSNRTSDTKKLLTVTRFVTITAALLALLLVLASIVLIGNTIRLSLFARRREIEVMKLVGATNWFIRWPFVIEGIIVGALGAVAAIAVLGAAKFILIDPLADNWNLISTPHTIGFVWLLIVLVGAGVAVSAVGSGMSLRRFLRV